jgi:glycosyltransferase involved in cell wall biosynthesis
MPGQKIIILMPTYNDWPSATALLPRIDSVLRRENMAAEVLMIDDGSNLSADLDQFSNLGLEGITKMELIELTHNLGNQRAIAVGISYVAAHATCDHLVVMDSDHEDNPDYIPRLVESSARKGGALVFAERTQRSEGIVFRVCYRAYRFLFRMLTGASISAGNFSVIPGHLIRRVASLPGLWSHYSSSIVRERIPFEMIASSRGERYEGRSSMNWMRLIVHGFAALAVHADIVTARLFIAFSTLLGAIVLGAIATFGVRLFANVLVPGWTSPFLGILLIIFVQTTIMIFVLFFAVLVNRSLRPMIPLRDHGDFIRSVALLLPSQDRAETVAS